MKKIISFLCAFVILFGAAGSVLSIDVSAADWRDNWMNTGKGEHQVLTKSNYRLYQNAEIMYTYRWRPKKYSVEFNLAVTEYDSSSDKVHASFRGHTGFIRVGGYVFKDYFRCIDDGYARVDTPDNCDGNYHSYRLEIDHTTNTQKIYYDGDYKGEWVIPEPGPAYTSDEFFFAAASTSVIEVQSVNIESLMNGQGYEFPTDYTAAYTENYTYSEAEYINGTTACRVPEGKWSEYFKCDTQNGTVSIERDKVSGGIITYIEHPLNGTTNFDWELRLKQRKVEDESLNQAGFTIRIATDSRYTWLKNGEGIISFKGYGENASDPNYTGPTHAIAYDIGYDWFNLKAEVRDQWITWYIQKDGDAAYKELVKYKMHKASMNLWSTAVGIDYGTPGLSGGFTIDWEKYTPYESSFYITSPASNTEFTEGDSVSFDVSLADNSYQNRSKMVDYYVNGIRVGTADSSDKFIYTLTEIKPGTYKVKAVCSDEKQSAEVPFTVKKSYSTSSSEKIPDDLGIAFVGKADEKWYTYKIVVEDFGGNKSFAENHDEFITVYRKERGDADSEYQELTGIKAPYGEDLMYTPEDIENADYLYGATFTTGADKLHLGYYSGRYNSNDKIETAYSVDNIQFSNGDDIAYSGYVSKTDAEIFVESLEEIEAIILASYDENNVLIDIDFAELNGGTNFADLEIKAGSVTKLYMWNKITEGKPLIDEPLEFGN